MSHQFSKEKTIAIEAVRTASRICRSVQASITEGVLEKKDRSPVTIADFASQAVICRSLEQSFPDDPIIGEEDSSQLQRPEQASFLKRILDEIHSIDPAATSQDVCGWIDRGNALETSERFWTLDPVDGTKGFLRQGQYAIALALIVNQQVQIAVLGCPNLALNSELQSERGAIFCAVRGAGSCVIPLDGDPSESSILVSNTKQAMHARFCESVESGHSSHGRSAQVAQLLGMTAESIRLDSQAKYAIVARGEADIYMRLPTRADYIEKIWDHAAGVLLVEEAGGRVSDLYGKPIEWNHGRELSANTGIIAANAFLHDSVLQALRDVFGD